MTRGGFFKTILAACGLLKAKPDLYITGIDHATKTVTLGYKVVAFRGGGRLNLPDEYTKGMYR